MEINLPRLVIELQMELKSSGVEFTENGLPKFTNEMFLKELPDEILPFNKRHTAKDKKKTLICYFQEDESLYPRLKNLDKDIPELQQYMGIGGFDLSPDINWPLSQQMLNILINQLVTAYFAIHGIKIIPNWRIGSLDTLSTLSSYPKNSTFIVGTLGCYRFNKDMGLFLTKAKVLVSSPSRLLIYGCLNQAYKDLLEEENIDYIVYPDYMTRRKQLLKEAHDGF